jgi:hypothetical protein
MARLINQGNVHDIKASLHNCEEKFTVKEFKTEIKAEKNGRNRKGVINLLNAAIRRKQGVKVNRSSIDGKFVSKQFATSHKKTTQSESIKK